MGWLPKRVLPVEMIRNNKERITETQTKTKTKTKQSKETEFVLGMAQKETEKQKNGTKQNKKTQDKTTYKQYKTKQNKEQLTTKTKAYKNTFLSAFTLPSQQVFVVCIRWNLELQTFHVRRLKSAVGPF